MPSPARWHPPRPVSSEYPRRAPRRSLPEPTLSVDLSSRACCRPLVVPSGYPCGTRGGVAIRPSEYSRRAPRHRHDPPHLPRNSSRRRRDMVPAPRRARGAAPRRCSRSRRRTPSPPATRARPSGAPARGRGPDLYSGLVKWRGVDAPSRLRSTSAATRTTMRRRVMRAAAPRDEQRCAAAAARCRERCET